MCGIVASFRQEDESLVSAMMDSIEHRGPDGRGVLRIGDSMLGHLGDWLEEPLSHPPTRQGAVAWVVGCVAGGVILAFGLYLLAQARLIG